MRLFFGLVASAFGFAALCTLPLAYDGAWYLFRILDLQTTHAPHTRLVNYLLHWPVILTASVTSDLRVLTLVFDGVYVALPLAALVACWWLVRKERPSLFIWPALALCLAVLPRQVLFVGESGIADAMLWILWLAILLGAPNRALIVAVPAAIVMFISHPLAAPYSLGCAGLALLLSFLRRDARSRLLFSAAALFALFLGKLIQFFMVRTAYEARELSLETQLAHFRASAEWLPTIAIGFAIVAGLLLVSRTVFARTAGALQSPLRVAEIAAIAAAGIVFAIWARDAMAWRYALDFRDMTPFSMAPFLLFAAIEGGALPATVVGEPSIEEQRHRVLLSQVTAVALLLALSLQSAVWFGLRRELAYTIGRADTACIPTSSIPWLERTPLFHWSTPTLSVLIQGRAPERVILPDAGCADPTFQTQVHIKASGSQSVYRSREAGWFDFSRTGLDSADSGGSQ